jgi:hypothetical protein
MTALLGKPRTTMPAAWAAKTKLIFAGDPLVVSTNHGIATVFAHEPVVETSFAKVSAGIPR